MLYQHYCPKCGKSYHSQERVLHICAECQQERELHLAYLAALYPSMEELGLDTTPTNGKYVIPYERAVRPHSDGKRVIRKSEPMGG